MSAFLCGPSEVGILTCWWCDGPVPRHATDWRFCSHECAADHAADIGDGPCTICGAKKGDHPIARDPHPYFPFGSDADEVYAATANGADGGGDR